MTATTLARTHPAAGASTEFPHVLDGVVLDGTAARLAGMLDRALLEEAGQIRRAECKKRSEKPA